MALERGAATIVIGFREEAWPKGHGYLYWRKEPGAMSGRTVETENMSPFAQGLVRKTLERLAARAPRAPQAE